MTSEGRRGRWPARAGGARTLTLLSSGRGSGASSAPSSTRQVEGRRASPPPPPLPPDISEPPLSAHTHYCQRRPRIARARFPLAGESGRSDESPQRNADGIYLAKAGGGLRARTRRAPRAYSPAPEPPRAPSFVRSVN